MSYYKIYIRREKVKWGRNSATVFYYTLNDGGVAALFSYCMRPEETTRDVDCPNMVITYGAYSGRVLGIKIKNDVPYKFLLLFDILDDKVIND